MPFGLKIFAIIPYGILIGIMVLIGNFLFVSFKNVKNLILKLMLGILFGAWLFGFLYLVWGVMKTLVS
jgi:hypothetical protein